MQQKICKNISDVNFMRQCIEQNGVLHFDCRSAPGKLVFIIIIVKCICSSPSRKLADCSRKHSFWVVFF